MQSPTKAQQVKIAIIGGTGCNQMAGFIASNHLRPQTPYGDVSGYFSFGDFCNVPVVFVNRHGVNRLAEDQSAEAQRHIPPHQVNYRANLWALQRAGVEKIIAVNAVGGIRDDCEPGAIMLPEQLVDYTWGRANSYFHYEDSPAPAPVAVNHVEFTEPFHRDLRAALQRGASKAGVTVLPSGCCAVTQGPRLETIAEVNRLQRDGCDIVGMTSMPEAALAAELGLQYASIAVVVNWAAGRPLKNGKPQISDLHAQMAEVLAQGMSKVEQLIGHYMELEHGA